MSRAFLKYAGSMAALAAAAVWLSRGAESKALDEERLWRHRNLGKAFFEDPELMPKAVEEFRQSLALKPDSVRDRINYGLALLRNHQNDEAIVELERAKKQDPSIPQIWYNLALAYRRAGKIDLAIAHYKQMAKLAPGDAPTHYALGYLYNMTDREDLALPEFAEAARLDPKLVAPTYQLFNAYRRAGREQEAARELAVLQRLKQEQKAADETEDIEWSVYSEVYDPIAAKTAAAGPAPARLKFEDEKLAAAVAKGIALADLDGDGVTDLITWGRGGVLVFHGGSKPAPDTALSEVKDALSVAPGDFDNDGRMDLAILTESGVLLYRNTPAGFVRRAQIAKGRFTRAIWVDYDHDRDLDLFLFGASSALYRNQGEAGFADQSAAFPFAPGEVTGAVLLRVGRDTKGFDVAVAYARHAGVLYRDQLRGRYVAEPLTAVPPGATSLETTDLDNDGWLDLIAADQQDAIVVANRQGRFEGAARIPAVAPVAAADLEARGFQDLAGSGAVFRNAGRFSLSRKPAPLPAATARAAADFDNDGRVDLAAVLADGTVHITRNRTASTNRWLAVKLTGVKELTLAQGSEVELRYGDRYQKRPYDGRPVFFGTGGARTIDALRVTWPGGSIQNLTAAETSRLTAVTEAPRMSGSCPMIFTWNGRGFEFITDVLGVAPLGAGSGDGTYFPVDHDEWVLIPGRALAARDGRYEVRITEELHEISYIDQVKLIAADHPADTDIYTNDKFKAPPFPEFRLFGVKRRKVPRRATDDAGRNVLPALFARDHVYPDRFERDYSGVARLHSLDLDFGPAAARDNRAILVLNGWVDWADGSTFIAASQEREGGLVMPYLQVKDASGRWRTVIENMGIPAGKPKTIVVDLSGKFLSASREVRIVTNLCVYWDEIFLSEDTAAPAVRQSEAAPASSSLDFRGFSTPVIHPRRLQPERFEYGRLTAGFPWNPTPGLYTRYGEVGELLQQADDRFVIMGSGDELRLSYSTRQLPALPEGWTRDFLLLVDGWAKDSDANTAWSQSVEPLPFHAMSAYPYAAPEHYPDDAGHRAYRERYNTRRALRLVEPLAARSTAR